VNGSSRVRLASLDLLLVVYLLNLAFFLTAVTVSPVNLVVDLRIHHDSVLLLLLQSHLTSRLAWMSTSHSTPHWFIVVVEFIFKGGLGLHCQLRLIHPLLMLVELLPSGLELGPIHTCLLQMFYPIL
jgi:hypothetical protein